MAVVRPDVVRPRREHLIDLKAARTVYDNVLDLLVKRCVGTTECRELHVLVENSDMAAALVVHFGLIGLTPGQASILFTELAGGIPTYCTPLRATQLTRWSITALFGRIQNAADYPKTVPIVRALM